MIVKTIGPPYYEIENNVGIWAGKLHQTGTAAPTVEVNQNTLGSEIIWTRDPSMQAGRYWGTVTGITFSENVFIEMSLMLVYNILVRSVNIRRYSDTQIVMEIVNNDGTPVDNILGGTENTINIKITNIQ